MEQEQVILLLNVNVKRNEYLTSRNSRINRKDKNNIVQFFIFYFLTLLYIHIFQACSIKHSIKLTMKTTV
jgi:hypothetical protein